MRLLALRTVLVALDADDGAAPIVETARRLAKAAGATLHVVHVEPDTTMSPAEPARHAASSRWLDAINRDADVPITDAKIHVMRGDPAHAIGVLADRVRADVIVLGPHRERKNARSDRLLGGTALAVVTNAFAPCLIVTEPIRLPLERVVVPVDRSDTARGALLVALSWASALRLATTDDGRERRTTLTALHVGASARALDDELAGIRRDAGSWAGLEIVGKLIAGPDVARVIADYATETEADLVVLGTRGLGLDAVGRLGSVSAAVAGLVRAPILLVPPAVWASQARSAE